MNDIRKCQAGITVYIKQISNTVSALFISNGEV